MFCVQDLLNKKNDLECKYRLFSEITSIISMIFSLFLIIVTVKTVKLNITNKLIIGVIISEILDGLNILLAIPYDSIGLHTFENYNYRMGVCFTQIYLAIFTCLWTLTSSFFISLRIYDLMVNKNKIFRKKFMYNYTTTISFLFSSVVSYILWSIQITQQSKNLKEKKIEDFYSLTHENEHFRHMYCWVNPGENLALLIIVVILISLNIFFSVFKGYCFVKKITNIIKDNRGRQSRISIGMKNKFNKINRMMVSLICYPVVSGLLWILFFVLQIIFNIEGIDKNGKISWFYCGLISARQLIYTILFFFSQKNIKNYSLALITCKDPNDFSHHSRVSINDGKGNSKNEKLLTNTKRNSKELTGKCSK